MSKIIDAIYEGGRFRPLESIPLREGQHVRLVVESVEATAGEVELTRDEAQRLLHEAGVLLELGDLEEDELEGEILSDEELAALIRQTGGGTSILDMLNDIRGEY